MREDKSFGSVRRNEWAMLPRSGVAARREPHEHILGNLWDDERDVEKVCRSVRFNGEAVSFIACNLLLTLFIIIVIIVEMKFVQESMHRQHSA